MPPYAHLIFIYVDSIRWCATSAIMGNLKYNTSSGEVCPIFPKDYIFARLVVF